MDNQVLAHYESHLAQYYGWMLGDMEAKFKEQASFFVSHQLVMKPGSLALDLGCGNGLQSIPLARLGYHVISVDFSPTLLKELKGKATGLEIQTIEADLLRFESYSSCRPHLVVCMGDTLTHLQEEQHVRDLITHIYSLLQPQGRLVLTYRDLSVELKDEKRFIPVRTEGMRLFTCFLEYFPDFVKVFDIVQERIGEEWRQKVSSYKKLRLSQEKVRGWLEEAGYSIQEEERTNNLVTLIAARD